jgi:hypothetical protein
VVASTNVYGGIAATIGGEHVVVTSIISDPEQDPHSYEADNQTLLRLSKADVVIENGGGYDDLVDRMLKASKKSPIVLDAVDISGHKAPAGGQLNEHVWYDLDAIREIARQIADAMAQSAPDDASTFSKNLAVFDRQLTTLINEEDGLKQSYAGTGVGITEPVPLYMLEAVGLVNKTPAAFSEAVEEGDDVSVNVLHQTPARSTSSSARRRRPRVLIPPKERGDPTMAYRPGRWTNHAHPWCRRPCSCSSTGRPVGEVHFGLACCLDRARHRARHGPFVAVGQESGDRRTPDRGSRGFVPRRQAVKDHPVLVPRVRWRLRQWRAVAVQRVRRK